VAVLANSSAWMTETANIKTLVTITTLVRMKPNDWPILDMKMIGMDKGKFGNE